MREPPRPRPRRSPCKQPMPARRHRRPKLVTGRRLTATGTGSDAPWLQQAKAARGLLAGSTASFSDDEEDLIIRLHALLGNRWSIIAGRLPGRTAQEVEAHWGSPAMRRRAGGADPGSHRALLQALLASSHDQHGEHLPRVIPNEVRREHRGRPSSSKDGDWALSDADSRWCLAQVNLELTLSTPCSTPT